MRVLVRIIPGPKWLPGRDVWGQGSAVRAHLTYMRDRFDTGVLLVGGPLRHGMAGMALLEVADVGAARAFAAADPAVAAGVLVYEVAEVLPYFDTFSGVGHAAVKAEASR